MEEVMERVAWERGKLESEISRQNFYCSRRKELVSPARCHDCFLEIPYSERLLRWNENRMACIAEHKESGSCDAVRDEKTAKPRRRKHKKNTESERYSIEAYISQGILEYLLELDTLSERFQDWQSKLTDSTRNRIHTSLDIQEMIVWFARKLAEFRSLLLSFGKINKENIKEE